MRADTEPDGADPRASDTASEWYQTLALPNGDRIAYVRSAAKSGDKRPGVVFLGGFISDMTGTKATHLEALCRARGQAYIRFDYQGHGVSSGRFEDGTIGRWAENALAVLDQVATGPQILVGSSMGGWIAVLVARARPDRVAGLVGIASAPDFSEELIRPSLDATALQALAEAGKCEIPGDEGEPPIPITQAFLDDGRQQSVLGEEIAIDCPVRLIHAIDDADVPWRQSLRLAQAVRTQDVTLTLVKQAGHRLSRPEDLDLIAHSVTSLSEDR